METRHTLIEDAYAIAIGSSFCGLGVIFLHKAGLVTGGAAGLALIGSYIAGIPVGLLFFVINVPFLVLARHVLGWKFAIKSTATVILLSLWTAVIPRWLPIPSINPFFAAIFGGTLLGMGILSLARHKSSVGGFGVLALYFYEKRGINVGRTQAMSDTLIIIAAMVAVDLWHVALSIVSAVAISAVIYVYHRPGRYTGH
jgi:uncharacterized membrane-anchored protein YitT (DUF2179 family)